MNRSRNTPGHRPALASSTTTCQKCLKKGHYSYECTASVQSRPYRSRPSRSQQLQNPKLQPRLSEAKLDDFGLLVPETTHKTPAQRAEHERNDEPPVKRVRHSPSTESSDSVSSISTRKSVSPPPGRESLPKSPSIRRGLRRSSGHDESRSRSPIGDYRRPQSTRKRSRSRDVIERRLHRANPSTEAYHSQPHSRKARSLSPFSKRLALTQALNL